MLGAKITCQSGTRMRNRLFAFTEEIGKWEGEPMLLGLRLKL